MRVKKIAFFLMFILFSTGLLFSKENIERVVVISYSEALNEGDKIWLPGSVHDKLISNLQTYTDFSFVTSNEEKIKEIQRKSESFLYSEETAIEVGKLTSATHAIFLTTRKAEKLYIVTAEFVNLTTGKLIATSMSTGKEDKNELFNKNCSAVDEITIDLCEKLGIPLSNTQKYILMKGSLNVSDEEKYQMFSKEIEKYNNQILQFDKEIALMAQSTDLSVSAKKSKLQAEKALAEQKKKVAQANRDRIADIEEQKQKEVEANEKRTKSQIEKINSISDKVNKKAAELRDLKLDKETSFGRLRIIEAKKEALVNLEENVNAEKEAVRLQIQENYDKKKDAELNREYRISEKRADGTLTNKALNEQNAKIKQIEKECEAQISSSINKIEASVSKGKAQIKSEVKKDLKNLEKTVFYANSINDTLRVNFNRYDGERCGWEILYTVLCEGIEFGQNTAFIQFDMVEKIAPSGLSYDDAVDMYDSLIRCNEPFLTYEISYSIVPDEYKVSTYIFNISKLRVFSTNSAILTADGKFKGPKFEVGKPFEVVRQMDKSFDYDKESREALIAKLEEQEARKEAREEAAQIRKEKFNQAKWEFYRKAENKSKMLSNVGFNMPLFDTNFRIKDTDEEVKFTQEMGVDLEIGLIGETGFALKVMGIFNGMKSNISIYGNNNMSGTEFFGFLGLGYSPIHNDFLSFALYALAGGGGFSFDTGINGIDYEFKSFGISAGGNGFIEIYFKKNFSIFGSFSAVYNFYSTAEIKEKSSTSSSKNPVIPKEEFEGHWKIIPSVGFGFNI